MSFKNIQITIPESQIPKLKEYYVRIVNESKLARDEAKKNLDRTEKAYTDAINLLMSLSIEDDLKENDLNEESLMSGTSHEGYDSNWSFSAKIIYVLAYTMKELTSRQLLDCILFLEPNADSKKTQNNLSFNLSTRSVKDDDVFYKNISSNNEYFYGLTAWKKAKQLEK